MPATVTVVGLNGETNALGGFTHLRGQTFVINIALSDGSVQGVVVPSNLKRDGGYWSRMLDVLGYVENVAGNGSSKVRPANTYCWAPINP